ncbi:MAG: DUF3858 domain-containing protein, partial [Bacteroidetes bacterium]|nr:DUF3858 domain-containing protein [Bacteroidota bacterium]
RAFETRNYIYNFGESELDKKLKRDNHDWQIENIVVDNRDSLYEPVNIKYDFTVTNYTQTSGMLYFNPFFSRRYSENPFKEITRLYPVDFIVPSDDVTLITVKIPVGYMIEELPKSGVFVLPNKTGKFSYFVEKENNIIKIRSQLTINKSLYEPNEYNSLKELYNLVIEKQAQQIVLKKL